MNRAWKRAIVVLGICMIALTFGAFLLFRMASQAVSNIFFPPVHGSLHVYTLDSEVLDEVWSRAAFQLAWTPAGNTIWVTDAGQPGDDASAVYEVNPTTGEATKLLSIGDGGYVSLAPAAGLVAYASGIRPPLSVRVASTNGDRVDFGEGNYPLLRDRGSLLTFLRPTCARQQTVFSADPLNPASSLARGPREQDGPQGSDFGLDSVRGLAVSPDQQHLVYWKKSYGDVFLRDVATASETSLGAGFPNVKWSPDGTMLALTLRPDGFENPDTQVLAVLAANDGRLLHSLDLRRIETHFDFDRPSSTASEQELMSDFEWSPDGKRIAIGVAGGGAWDPPCGS